ncbi:hypothetical protein ACHAW5_004398 [Stephanodiscus triporus]|uniref:SET domain-containing protein n=1 Tax=Stephanodiscus triporus TaxID=2934178 RepID=A0ABD3QK72_9STRA
MQLQSSEQMQIDAPQTIGDTPLTKPDDWEKLGYYDIKAHVGCDEYSNDLLKPLPTLADWEYLRSKYIEIVDKHAIFDDPVPPTEGYTFDENGPPPYYAAHGKHGRGVFASRDIKRGEFVQDGNKGDIEFPDGEAWRRYVFSLPKNRACDILAWTWTQKKSREGKWKIYFALNISILFNGAYDGDANIRPSSSISSRFYALRHIKKGEELLYDYGVYDTVWAKVGLETKAERRRRGQQ